MYIRIIIINKNEKYEKEKTILKEGYGKTKRQRHELPDARWTQNI